MPGKLRFSFSGFLINARIFFQSAGIGGPLIVLWIILGFFAPWFFTLTIFGNLSVQFAIIGALAIGSTAVIICREIDLSIGAVEGF